MALLGLDVWKNSNFSLCSHLYLDFRGLLFHSGKNRKNSAVYVYPYPQKQPILGRECKFCHSFLDIAHPWVRYPKQNNLTHCVIIFISVRIFIRMSTPGKSQKIDDFMNSSSILGFVTYGGITKTLRLPTMVASTETTTTSTIWDCVIGCSGLPFIGFIDFTMWAQRDLEKKIYDVFRRMTVVCQWGATQFSKMLQISGKIFWRKIFTRVPLCLRHLPNENIFKTHWF